VGDRLPPDLPKVDVPMLVIQWPPGMARHSAGQEGADGVQCDELVNDAVEPDRRGCHPARSTLAIAVPASLNPSAAPVMTSAGGSPAACPGGAEPQRSLRLMSR
jgi:hypothetical protein